MYVVVAPLRAVAARAGCMNAKALKNRTQVTVTQHASMGKPQGNEKGSTDELQKQQAG